MFKIFGSTLKTNKEKSFTDRVKSPNSGLLSSLSLRSPLTTKQMFRTDDKNAEDIPVISTLRNFSKDLLPPFSLRSRELAAISDCSTPRRFEGLNIPMFPKSQIKLKPLKHRMKKRNLGYVEECKDTFFSVQKFYVDRKNAEMKNGETEVGKDNRL